MEFKCDQCELKYKCKDGLNKHHARKHQMIRFQCVQCDTKYATTQALQNHVRDKHTGEKLKCDSCDFETGVANGKTAIVSHKRLKHGERKLECGLCEYIKLANLQYCGIIGNVTTAEMKNHTIAINVITVVALDLS